MSAEMRRRLDILEAHANHLRVNPWAQVERAREAESLTRLVGWLRGALLEGEQAESRVRALCDEWWGRATEATPEPLSWRRVCGDLRAALDGT